MDPTVLHTIVDFFQGDDSSSDDDLIDDACFVAGLVGRTNLERKHSYLEVIHNMSDEEFQQNFRLTRNAFNCLLLEVGQELESDNPFKKSIDPELQLLASIWILSTPDSYRSISSRFEMAKSTLFTVFERVIRAINNRASSIIKWPNIQERLESERHFHSLGQIHGCIGAIDGTYIPIKAPKENPEIYINRKCFYGITLQAICDDKRQFIDVFCGYPSSVSDVRIFRNSCIYKNIIENKAQYFAENTFIIGDKAYPLHEWCITPFIDRGNLQPHQSNFNTHHSKMRQVIERSFALLFGRFRRLKYLDMNRIDLIPFVVQAACVLHNICLKLNDESEDYVREGELFLGEENAQENVMEVIIHDQAGNEGVRIRDELAARFLL